MDQLSFFSDIPAGPKATATCGSCVHFGTIGEYNCAPCLIDAFGDGYPIHRRYKSPCRKYIYSKQKANRRRALIEAPESTEGSVK